MICPYCGKESDTTTCVNGPVFNPLLNVAAGCQLTWQGVIVFSVANAMPVQFPVPLQTTVCAGAANPGTFQVIKL